MTYEVKIEADSINDIARHLRYAKLRSYLCAACDKRFRTKTQLDCHNRKVHDREKLYSCYLCEKRFPTLHRLTEHNNVHNGKYMCLECGSCYVNKYKLTEHRRSHSGEKPFECTVCSKRFRSPNGLVEHTRVVHGGKKRLSLIHI